MNTQKQVTITDLKGKFTKDFDTFGKMDPFLEFTVGKSFVKTEIASGAGKQPVWKDPIVLTYFDETQILVKAYDDDVTEKQYIGTGKLQIKSLRFPGGTIQITILSDNGQNMGTISGKYTIKNLPANPLLLLKNFKLELTTQQKAILKSKPFIQFSTDQNSTATDPKDQVKALSIAWNQNLRIRIKQSSKITISLIDKDNKEDYLFKYQCFAKQFRIQNGVKKFNVFNKKFERFAVLHFDYDTINLVSKEESVKNIQKQKKAENQLTVIAIEKISNELKIQGQDLYFKLIVGTNNYTSQLFKKNQKNFTVQLKKTLYAEDKQNRLSLVFFNKKLISDEIVGFGHISLESLYNGEKKISLFNQKKEDIGTSTLALSFKTSPCKIINIENLTLNVFEGGDMIGQSEPFIVARIGNCTGQTQVEQSHKATFKKNIELKYVDEEFLIMQIWDQDATTNQLLYSQKTKLSELKNKGQHQITYKAQKNGKTDTKAKLSFKYQMKVNVPEQPPKKPTQKKIVQTQSPKKQVIAPVNPNTTINTAQSQKPKIEPKKVQEVQQKPIKKEEPAPPVKKEQAVPVIQKPLPNQEVKPAPALQNIKTQENQQEKPKESNIKNQQPQTKRDENIKKSSKQDSNTIHKSRETLVLPSIIAGNKFFGDKIFDKQSAATLQKSILAYSMPKAMRFTNEPKYSGQPTYCMDSCFRPNPNKGVGFGFGGKRQFPQWMERNMKENPPPGAYFDDKNGQTSKGPTFGLSHKYYQKVIIPKEQKSNTSGQTVRKLSPIRDPPK